MPAWYMMTIRNSDLWDFSKPLKLESSQISLMDKRDTLVLAGILIGVSIPVTLTMLVANGILDNPIP